MSIPRLAPDFTLLDQNGQPHSLHDYLGKWVVLYFYPKDDTPGCTTEACNFRDSFRELQKLGIVILGVSKDSVVSHGEFASKYQLNFPILSDPDHKVIEQYDAHSLLGTLRMTYLINSKGEIAKVYPHVNPTVHAAEILADLPTLK
ncbi:MAG: peroxiredoxin [bacterium]